jgi:hypothetical protein
MDSNLLELGQSKEMPIGQWIEFAADYRYTPPKMMYCGMISQNRYGVCIGYKNQLVQPQIYLSVPSEGGPNSLDLLIFPNPTIDKIGTIQIMEIKPLSILLKYIKLRDYKKIPDAAYD